MQGKVLALFLLLSAVLVSDVSANWFRNIAKFGAKVHGRRQDPAAEEEDASGAVRVMSEAPVKEKRGAGHVEAWCHDLNSGRKVQLSTNDMKYVLTHLDENKDGVVNWNELKKLKDFMKGDDECIKLVHGNM